MYETVLEDDTDCHFFFDALEEINSSLDVINTIDIDDYPFSFEDPSNPYSFSNEGSAAQHREYIYCTTTGAEHKLFVTESEDNSTLPHDPAYWHLYFLNQNVSYCIYQGMTDVSTKYDINTKDMKKSMAPVHSHVQAPSKIEHAAISLFYARMPVE